MRAFGGEPWRGAMKDVKGSEEVILAFDSSAWDESVVEILERNFAGFDVSEEAVNHSGQSDGMCRT